MSKKKWFADVTGTTRIDIPAIEGWIEVRNELSVGEERKVFAGAIKGQTPTEDGKIRTEYDAEKVSFGLVRAYVVDWSARDEKDKPVEFSEGAVKALTPEAYTAIEDAVNKHAKAMKEQRIEGKAPGGVTATDSAVISPSAA